MASTPDQKNALPALAIIGNKELVEGFLALGFSVYPAVKQEEIEAALQEVVRKGCAVCLIETKAFRQIKAQLALFEARTMPVFIPFSKESGESALQDAVREIRLRATGKV